MKNQFIARRNQNQKQQVSWRRLVRKLLNIPSGNYDYSADSDTGSDSDSGEELCNLAKESRFKDDNPKEHLADDDSIGTEAFPRLRRRKSETFRAQYINTKEIRVCAGTWNVGGINPPDELDLSDWLDTDDPADLYVIGLQEIIPLNAGNVFGAEDNRQVTKWENIIRKTLKNQLPLKTKFKSFSDPPSPSRFKPTAEDIACDVVLESDSESEDETETEVPETVIKNDGGDQKHFSSPKRLDALNCLRVDNSEEERTESVKNFPRTLSGTERIGLSWPEKPLNLLAPPKSFSLAKSLEAAFRSSSANHMRRDDDIAAALAETDLDSLINRRRRRAPYVRIISKQMVGLFVTIWVRRHLRKHIENINVSTVGVGVMGYIGNKGSISVSMSIYQTLFCFICTHLSAGEKDTDTIKRNADVQEIHRRTRFNSLGLPRKIYDHERIIWLGDLNYRINISYGLTRELISKNEWSKLIEGDQLFKELKRGRLFDGWSEGSLTFAPTYKYEINSESYLGGEGGPPKAGRRTPAWCDRVLSFGRGMKLLNYKRSESKLSDHRPVAASYMVEVEVFSTRKLQKALTFTDAEVDIIQDSISLN